MNDKTRNIISRENTLLIGIDATAKADYRTYIYDIYKKDILDTKYLIYQLVTVQFLFSASLLGNPKQMETDI